MNDSKKIIDLEIGMVVKVAFADDEEDPYKNKVGELTHIISKKGMVEPLYGVMFGWPIRANDNLPHFYHARELKIIAELGEIDDLEIDEPLRAAVDNLTHEIVAMAIEDLADEYPGLGSQTRVKSRSKTLDTLMQERLMDWLENRFDC